MGTSEKSKRRSGWRWLAIVGALLVLVIGGVGLSLLPRRVNADAQKVREILDSSSTNRGGAYRALVEMGPKAYPEMRVWIEYKESRFHERFRTNWWKKLPATITNMMENPLKTRNRHITAVMITGEIGPMFVRPLTTSLCKVGEDPDWIARGAAVQSLYWSVPESAAAKKRIAEWVGEVGHLGIGFGPSGQNGEDMWAKLPEMASLHARALRCVVSVSQSAIALGAMGTNAAIAIPALIEVCDNGFASPQIAAQPGQFVGKGGLWTNGVSTQTRAPGYMALGKIGISTPEVLAAVKRGFADTNPQVQMAALTAWQGLRQSFGTNVAGIVVGIPPETGGTFPSFVRWAGTLGKDGRELLPWLTQFTSLEFNKSLPGSIEASNRMAVAQRAGQTVTVDFNTPAAMALRVSAIGSICQIGPEEIPKYLPDLRRMIAQSNVADLLESAKGQAAEIVPVLEPELGGTNLARSSAAAYIVTGLSPGHAEGMKVLREGMTRGTLNDRMAAGLLYWKRTGESKELLALCVEGLNTPYRPPPPGSFPGTIQGTPATATRAAYYSAVLTLQEMGPAVRPIIPELKAAARSPNQVIRNGAALMLYKYAPEELPKVE